MGMGRIGVLFVMHDFRVPKVNKVLVCTKLVYPGALT